MARTNANSGDVFSAEQRKVVKVILPSGESRDFPVPVEVNSILAYANDNGISNFSLIDSNDTKLKQKDFPLSDAKVLTIVPVNKAGA